MYRAFSAGLYRSDRLKTIIMKNPFKIFPALLSLVFFFGCSKNEEYQVYAIKFRDGWKIQAKDYVTGANPSDSVDVCNMFWLIKSDSKNILVDAGFIDPTGSDKNFVRPDSMLKRLNIEPSDISDIVITHPHTDHIGGLTLFPEARVWMQQDDYDYFTGPAWEEGSYRYGFEKNDVENIIAVNLQGRLKLIKGDNIEIMPGIRVYTGSKHTFENQYLLVNSNSEKNKILLASDAIWFYLNLEKELPVSVCMDTLSYVTAIKRMKTLVTDPDLIIPGHDDLVFSKFTAVQDWIVRIGE
jgi:glyoxylase-like metal-dependent hydrolase (beta-lactamase superfamily II)